MEFNEKLQYLRKQHSMTQEQLAEKLYVSRTAISKWESGKGYPNIESLKSISKVFSVSIDELLSGEELIELAETENHSNLDKIYRILDSILDLMAIGLIILPLYGKRIGGYIYSVNLFSFSLDNPIIYAMYWIILIALISIGITKLIFIWLNKNLWYSCISTCSIILDIVAIFHFSAAREPYVTAFLFLFFILKIFMLLKNSHKSLKKP